MPLTGRITAYKQTGKTETLTDTMLLSSSATSLATQAIPIRAGQAAGAVRRTILLDPMANPGRVESCSFGMNVIVEGTANFVVGPIIGECAKLSPDNSAYQYVSISGTDDWDDAATGTTGAGTPPGMNIDSNVRAIFSMVTGTGAKVFSDVVGTGLINPSSGSLDAVWNAARKAALEQGAAYAGVMIYSEDESTATEIRANTLSSLSFDLYPSPLDGWMLETVPQLRLPTTSGCRVGVQLGTMDFSGFTIAGISLVGSIPTEITNVKDLTALTDPSDADGEYYSAALAVSEAYEVYGGMRPYIIRFQLDGNAFDTPFMYGTRLVGDNTMFKSGVTGDDHKHALLNHAAGKTVSGTTDGAEGLAAQRAAEEYVASRWTLLDPLHPRYWMFAGDNMDFCQYTSFQCFPIKKDGSGVADDAADTIIAKDAADAYEVVRSYMVQSYFPWELIPSLLCIGNHAPYHWHGFSANNGAVSNVSQWILDALITFELIPADDDVDGYDQPTSNKGLGHYAFKCGNTQTVVVNVGHASQHSGDISDFTAGDLNEYPVTLGAPSDWKINSTVLSWLGGVYTNSTAIMLDQFQHNPMGNRSVIPNPLYYDRADYKDWFGGYFGTNVLPLIVARFGGRWFLNLGHDHNEDYVYHDSGGCVAWHATPGNNSTEGPYNKGFAQVNGGDASGLTLHGTGAGQYSNRLDNAGQYIRTHSLSKIRRDFVFTGVSTDDAGTEYLLTATNYTNGYLYGDILRTLEIPRTVSGPTRRAHGNRAHGKRAHHKRAHNRR